MEKQANKLQAAVILCVIPTRVYDLDHAELSFSQIEEEILANAALQKELELSSISESQLSRSITKVPTEMVQELFLAVTSKLQSICKNYKGINERIGVLKIIDSSKMSLGANLCNWAFVDKKWTGIKIHTKVVVAGPDTVFAEQNVLSTGNVDDRHGSAVLVMEADATYVLDRGYIDHGRMDDWD